MKCDKKAMILYAVTDRAWVGRQSLYEQVESALKGGATCVQLREKELDDEMFLTEAMELADFGMIPNGPQGDNCMRRLRVYAGETHNHAAQKPELLDL